jgi:hypothetical protein
MVRSNLVITPFLKINRASKQISVTWPGLPRHNSEPVHIACERNRIQRVAHHFGHISFHRGTTEVIFLNMMNIQNLPIKNSNLPLVVPEENGYRIFDTPRSIHKTRRKNPR